MPCRQPRSVYHHINFLRPLDLKNFRDRLATPGRRLPMHFIETVAGHILAQLFEIAPLAHLPLRVDAERTAVHEQRREIFALGKQVRVNANLGLRCHLFASGPESKRRIAFQINRSEAVVPTLARRARPRQMRPLAACGQRHRQSFLIRNNFLRQCQAHAQLTIRLRRVAQAQFQFRRAVFRHPSNRRQLGADAAQAASRPERICRCQHHERDDERHGHAHRGRFDRSQQRERQHDDRRPNQQAIAGNDHPSPPCRRRREEALSDAVVWVAL